MKAALWVVPGLACIRDDAGLAWGEQICAQWLICTLIRTLLESIDYFSAQRKAEAGQPNSDMQDCSRSSGANKP